MDKAEDTYRVACDERPREYDDGPGWPRENPAKERAFRRAFVDEARRIVRDWTAPPETDTSDPFGETVAAAKLRVHVRERFAVYEPGDAGPKTYHRGYQHGHEVPAARLRGSHHAMVYVTEPCECPGWPDIDIFDPELLRPWLLAVEGWAVEPIPLDRIVPPPRPFDALQAEHAAPEHPAITDAPASQSPPLAQPGASLTPPKATRQLVLTRADQIEIRPPDWLLRGAIERDAFALVFGDPGCGKSFLAIDWACRVATGTPWRGYDVKAGPVVYVAGEGQQGFGRRIRAWSEHHGVGLDGVPLYLSPAVAMPDPADLKALITAIDTGVAAVGQRPTLIVLDTLARNFGGGDENATPDMGRFVLACDAVRTLYGCTVLVVHHSGHADKSRARGAIALKAALDAEYRLSNEGGLLLTATKMKEAELPPTLSMELVTVELPGLKDEFGLPVTSAAIDVTDADTSALVAKTRAVSGRRGKALTLGLDVARRLVLEADDGRVGLKEWHDACQAAGMQPSTRYSVLGKLRERGEIDIDGEALCVP